MKIIEPTSTNKDIARIQLILNTLLVSSFFLSSVAVLQRAYYLFFPDKISSGIPLFIPFLISLTFLALLFLSRRGRPRVAAVIFILLLLIPTLYMSMMWGSLVPQAVAMYGLVVILAGILVHSSAAILLTVLITAFLVTLSFAQYNGILEYHQTWQLEPFGSSDALFTSITIGVMAVVTWLSNREIERSLVRARASEAALKKERDLLEMTVEKRTQALKKAQLEKMIQLNRFVDFGRVAAGLLHDFINPLTVVSLTLDELKEFAPPASQQVTQTEELLNRASKATHKLERFVQAARKQVQPQDSTQTFSVQNEVQQVVEMLAHKARKAKVTIEVTIDPSLKLTGNPVKFFQIVLNLVSNAIDAYQTSRKKNRLVTISTNQSESKLTIRITDHGSGISAKHLPFIFDPFFTTKSIENGTGIGLAITKTSIEEDFDGSIQVQSSPKKGTVFRLEIPLNSGAGRKQSS